MDEKYVRFEIESALGKESYICAVGTEKKGMTGYKVSIERQCEDFLAKHCYCDAYELLSVRDCTEEEVNLLMQYLNEEDMRLWDAQNKVCYPNGDSINEQIYRAAKRVPIDKEELEAYLDADTSEIENPAFFMFYKKCMDAGMHIADAERYAILNTLFGYDIGMETAEAINNELWEMEIDTYDIASGSIENRKYVEEAVEKAGVEIDFSNWQEGEYEEYRYFIPPEPQNKRKGR